MHFGKEEGIQNEKKGKGKKERENEKKGKGKEESKRESGKRKGEGMSLANANKINQKLLEEPNWGATPFLTQPSSSCPVQLYRHMEAFDFLGPLFRL